MLWHSLYSIVGVFYCKFENRCLSILVQALVPTSSSSLHWSLPGSPLLTLFFIAMTGTGRGTSRRHLWCFEQNQCLAPRKGRQNVQ